MVELAARDGETTTARKTQQKTVKVLSGVTYKRFIESFDILPSEPVPPSPNDLQWDRVEGASAGESEKLLRTRSACLGQSYAHRSLKGDSSNGTRSCI